MVGISDSPEGPFNWQWTDKTPVMEHKGVADFSLFKDGDDAYIVYGSWYNGIEKEGWKSYLPDWMQNGH